MSQYILGGVIMDGFEIANILLIDDDPGDQKLIKTSLKSDQIANNVVVQDSGEEALEYLEKAYRKEENYIFPDLILLDLNMPGMGGKEFLRIIKENQDFSTIPVVILTTSDNEKDIADSFQLQASGYIKKTASVSEMQKIMSNVEDYWFVICKRVKCSQEKCGV
jgi:CheY-like chemotaxis protein